MKIICVSGKAQHGKDTTGALIYEELEQRGNRVLLIHYADLLKYICTNYFGWCGQKDTAGRTLLQRVGTDVIRAQNPDFWVEEVAKVLSFFPDEWDYVIIPDTRFPNECEYLRKKGYKTYHVRVVRNNFISPLTLEQQNHISETALDNYPFDFRIHNDGTVKDLVKHVKSLCNWIS